MSQLPYKMIVSSIPLLIILVVYLLRRNVNDINDEEINVSLCQIRIQFDGSDGYDDRTLLSLLAVLKKNDFFIGRPVWVPSDTLIYLCEYRLKIGLKQSQLDKELQDAIKNSPVSSERLAWSCA